MSLRRRSGASRRAKEVSSGAGGEINAEPEGAIAQESSREVSTQQGFTTGCEDDEASAFGVNGKDLQPEDVVEEQLSQTEKACESTPPAVADADEKREAEEELIEEVEGEEGVDKGNCEEGEKKASLDAAQTGNANPSVADPEAESHEGAAAEVEAEQTEGNETDDQVEQLASEEGSVPREEQPLQQAQGKQPEQQQLPEKELQVPQEHQQQHEQQRQSNQGEQTLQGQRQPEEEAQHPQQDVDSQQEEHTKQEEEAEQEQQLETAEERAAVAEEDRKEEMQQEGREGQDARGAVPQELQEAASFDFSGFVRDVWEESELESGVAPSPSSPGVCCDDKSVWNVCDQLFVCQNAPYGPEGRRRVFQDAKALVWDRIPAAVSRYAAEAQRESVGDACLSCTGDVIDGCLPTTQLLSELLVAGSAALASLFYTYRCEICEGLLCLLNSTFNCFKTCVCVVTPPPQVPRPAQRMNSINWVSLGESTELATPPRCQQHPSVYCKRTICKRILLGDPRPSSPPIPAPRCPSLLAQGDEQSLAEATGEAANAALNAAAKAAAISTADAAVPYSSCSSSTLHATAQQPAEQQQGTEMPYYEHFRPSQSRETGVQCMQPHLFDGLLFTPIETDMADAAYELHTQKFDLKDLRLYVKAIKQQASLLHAR
ncbi:hypothetical protein Esti_005127 [Eimeria stiedai]